VQAKETTMRVAFLGSPPFAVPVFRRLCASSHSLTALVTRPDKPKGRGRKIESSPLAEVARERGVPVLQPASTRDPAFVAELRALAPEALLVASYGEILRPELLALAPRGAFNVHASLLPRHRGASPIQAALLAGDRETGVTIQKMVQKLDEGDVVLLERTSIGEHENAGELLDRLARLGGEASVRALDLLERGEARFTPQDATLATYAKKISKEDGRIDWSQPAAVIGRVVRAFTPWPGAHTSDPRGAELAVLDVRAVEPAPMELRALLELESTPSHAPLDGPEAGTIVVASGAPFVVTGDGLLELCALKPAGKGRMDGAAWLRGARLEPGARLGGGRTP
jgi:methionyl-tRNA formyltransferase